MTDERSKKIRAMLKDENHAVVEVTGPEDKRGPSPFTLYWLTTYIPGLPCNGKWQMRAQCFKTVVGTFVRTLKSEGNRIVHVIHLMDKL